MRLYRALALTAVTAFIPLACGDDSPTGPDNLTRAEVVGTYTLTDLSFDPQGSLPEVDLRDRLVVENPSIQLTQAGDAQLTFRDPDTNLLVTVNGTFTTTPTDVRVDFGEDTRHQRLLLPRNTAFEFQGGATTTLIYQAEDGAVSRQRLLELVPEFEGEQLLDPVPGVLEVRFQK